MTDCMHVRDQLLEGDADTRVALADHLEGCAGCRQLAQAIADVDRSCQEAFEPLLNAPLAPPKSSTRTWRLTMPALILATAASLALALWPGLSDRSTTAKPTVEGPAPDDLAGSSFLVPWNALTEKEWGERAAKHLAAYQTMGGEHTPRSKMRALAEIGLCAENANEAAPPYYQSLDGSTYNVAWAAAATVEVQHPGTLDGADLPTEVANGIRYLAKTFAEKPLATDAERALFSPAKTNE
jgi:hypothetical protein